MRALPVVGSHANISAPPWSRSDTSIDLVSAYYRFSEPEMIPAKVICAVHGFLVRNSAVDDTGVGLPQMELFEISSKICDRETAENAT